MRRSSTAACSIPLGNLLANTHLTATVPERVAQMLVRIAHVKPLAPPIRVTELFH
jgi:hypothetical protein